MYAAIVVLHVQEHILGLEIHYMLMFETENTVTPDCSRILSTSVAIIILSSIRATTSSHLFYTASVFCLYSLMQFGA